MEYIGDFNTGATVRGMWNSNAVAGGSVTRATNGSIRIYKNNSTTERSSSAGITDTEDFDSLTGVHHVNIDLSDNTDSGFYAAGNDYFVVLQGATIDGQSINAYLFCFSIENRNIKANVTQFNGTNGTFSSGRPEVNTTHVAGTSQTARDIGASVLISSGTGTGQLSVASGVIQSDIAKCGGSTVAAGAIPNVAAGSTGGLILIGTGTRDINPNAGGVVITSTGIDDIADSILDRSNGIETGITPRQMLRAIGAMLAGIISGGGSGTEVFKAVNNSGTTRLTITVDSSGNRSSITYNL